MAEQTIKPMAEQYCGHYLGGNTAYLRNSSAIFFNGTKKVPTTDPRPGAPSWGSSGKSMKLIFEGDIQSA